MDIKYINPFILATKTVFKTMLNLEVTMDKPRLKTDRTTSGNVTGFVMGVAVMATEEADVHKLQSKGRPLYLQNAHGR